MYRGLSGKPALVKEILSILDECKTCRVLPEDTFRAAAALREDDPALADKLADLSQLYTMYDSLCETTLPDPREALTRMAEALPAARSWTARTSILTASVRLHRRRSR